MTCNRWACEHCIDGSCPITLEKKPIRGARFSIEDFELEPSCEECCNRKEGCDNCILKDTEWCTNYEQKMEEKNV